MTADIKDADGKTPWERYKESILEVFEILQRRSQEFGFRVQKEMLAYARVDYHLHVSEGGKGHADYPEGKTPKSPQPWDWQRCFDEQLMQKVLPKMHGDQAKLDPVLAALAAYCLKGGDKAKALEQILKNSGFAKGERDFEKLLEIEAELGNESIEPDERVARFPLSYAKLSRMQEVLQRDQFVSYIH